MRYSKVVSYLGRYFISYHRVLAVGKSSLVQTHALSTNINGSNLSERQKQVLGKGLPKKQSIQGVKHTILVCSGKGGVGKSTTSVNLAVALAKIKEKHNVGLLDADVFGPTIPTMMNLNESPLLSDDKKFIPLENYNVKCMSMGFLVDEKAALVWRGLMVMSALEKLLRQVDWGALDYLVIDTPPGTGDTLLSLLQNIPVSGIVLVTTPQNAAVNVARRGATMIQKLDVPIIGIVENMSHVICPKCDHNFSIFNDNTSSLSQDLGVPILCKVPVNSKIALFGDEGTPITVKDPKGQVALTYLNLAERIVKFLQEQKPSNEQ